MKKTLTSILASARFSRVGLALLLLTATICRTQAQSASGTIQGTQLGDGSFNYTMLITDTDNTKPIGIFWFSFSIDANKSYMATSPLSVSGPAGWTPSVIGPGDGFSIEYVANGPGSYLQPSNTLTFTFQSMDTPDQMATNSIFDSSVPVTTSSIFLDNGFGGGTQFVVQPLPPILVPEPSTCSLAVIGAAGVWATGRRRFGKKSQI